LNERVLGFLRLKHMLYLFASAILLWHGYGAGKPGVLGLGLVAGILTILSMSFEARLLAYTVSAISSVGSSRRGRPGGRRSETGGQR
jgi:hypothetical protein